MHPWHDVYIDEDQLESTFPVVIEVPMGSKNKYELDKESSLLRLNRVLFSAISANDPVYQDRRTLEDLPDHKLREIQRFFEDHKALENKGVVVEGMQEREAALGILREGLVMYRQLRRGELKKG